MIAAVPSGTKNHLQPLVERLSRAAAGPGRGVVVAFTSPTPGDGVSYVVESVGRELAHSEMQPVLVAGSRGLVRLSPAKLRANEGVFEAVEPNIVTLRNDDLLPFETAGYALEDAVEMLRRWFRFTLIDCPALDESPQALSVAPHADGTVLVVGAGRTTRRKIERAKNLLLASPCPLFGSVLNRRTYPVPGFVYGRL